MFEFTDSSSSSNNFSLGWRRKLAKHGGRRRGSGGGEEDEGQEGEVVDIFPDEEEEGGVWVEEEGGGGDKDHDDAGIYTPTTFVGEYGGREDGGVVGVYNSTPEFLAVVPFTNSYVSFLHELLLSILSNLNFCNVDLH